MKTIKLLSISTIALLALAGCNQQSPETNQSFGPTPAASEASAPSSAIPADDINLTFEIVDGPTYDAASDSVAYQIQASNEGKATLASDGPFPVNIGVVIRDTESAVGNSRANQDFMRIPLPAPLLPGQKVTLPITFDAAPVLGATVVIDGVQEGVFWFSDHGKPALTLGSYGRCTGIEETLCLADGTAITTAQ